MADSANVKLNKILNEDLQESLLGAEFVIFNSIWNLSSRAGPGMDRLTIPRYAGLTATTVVDGVAAAGTSVQFNDDQLLLDSPIRTHDFIGLIENKQTMTDRESAFTDEAPGILAENVEDALDAALDGASANDFQSTTGTNSGEFSLADVTEAKRILDNQKVKKSDRWLVVNSTGMAILNSFDEFQDASQSASTMALEDGVIAKIKGFNVIQSESVADNKVHCYHRKALAFAFQDTGVIFTSETDLVKNEKFVQAQIHYGEKLVNSGLLKVTITGKA